MYTALEKKTKEQKGGGWGWGCLFTFLIIGGFVTCLQESGWFTLYLLAFIVALLSYAAGKRKKARLRQEKLKKIHLLLFDTETTGLLRKGGEPAERPRLVQLACLLTDINGNEMARWSGIVKPDGFEIPQEATAVHGISTETALAKGVSAREAINAFLSLYDRSNVVIAHNAEFDQEVIMGEIERLDCWGGREPKPVVDTMKPTAEFVGIYSSWKGDYKWPKLSELHEKLFGRGFDGAHDAMADVEACARCYFELVKRKLIEVTVE